MARGRSFVAADSACFVRVGALDRIALVLEHVPQQLAGVGVVVHDDDTGGVLAGPRRCTACPCET